MTDATPRDRRLPTLLEFHTRLSREQPALFADRVGESDFSSLVVRSPAGDWPNPPLSELTVQIALRGVLTARINLGAGRIAGLLRPGQFVVAPAGLHTEYTVERVESGIDGQFEILALGFPRALLARLAEERGLTVDDGLAGLHDAFLGDDAVVRLAEMLRPDPTNPLLEDASFVDHAGHALVQRLLGLAAARRGLGGDLRPPAGLSRRERAAVLAFVDARIAHAITVADLARLLDRSESELSATFRHAFGLTPYALVVTRRIERAKTLMRLGDLPLAEVALAAGFSSQAHFTTAFRKAVGTTPARWREQAREGGA